MERLRKISLVTILLALAICLSGCENSGSTFSGSKTGNDNQFLVDFDVLNTTVDSEMPLSNGDTIETTIDIDKGVVDILVKNENGTIAYQGDDVESSNFMIEIVEAGDYTFAVTGSKAKGSVHFNNTTIIPLQYEDEQQSDETSIDYKCFYSGFVLEKDIFELPRGVLVFNTEREWKAFKSKYFAKSGDMDYIEELKDFTNNSILYYSKLSSLPTVYSSSFEIDKITVSENSLNVLPKDIGDANITVSNHDNNFYRFVTLAVVSKSDIGKVTISNDKEADEKWEQIDRFHYVQGTIVSLEKISDGKSILTLKIEKNYQSGPVDKQNYPFTIGGTVEFYLNGQPVIDLKKMKRVIVYESDVTTGEDNSFLAASIKYYEKDGEFFDMEGKQISLPPTEYPQTLD